MSGIYHNKSERIASEQYEKFLDNADIEFNKFKRVHVEDINAAFGKCAKERELIGDEAASMFPTATMVKIMQLADCGSLGAMIDLCVEIRKLKAAAIESIAERRAEQDIANVSEESFLPD